jgi:hypothetical protein
MTGGGTINTAYCKLVQKIKPRISGLKVPKREIFVTELFTLSVPIWIGDLIGGLNQKIHLC